MPRKKGSKAKKPRHKSSDGIKKGQYHKDKRKNHDENGKFAKGNDLWMVAGKGGREKAFESPEALWKAYVEYSDWNEANPWQEAKLVPGKNGHELKDVPLKRVKTVTAFCEYVGVTSSYFRAFKSQERKDKDAFITVINAIEDSITNQKFSGAVSGFFNASIISRDLGMVEKIENPSAVPQAPVINIIKGNTPKLSNSEKDVDVKKKSS